jgi:hypothetical protein
MHDHLNEQLKGITIGKGENEQPAKRSQEKLTFRNKQSQRENKSQERTHKEMKVV